MTQDDIKTKNMQIFLSVDFVWLLYLISMQHQLLVMSKPVWRHPEEIKFKVKLLSLLLLFFFLIAFP